MRLSDLGWDGFFEAHFNEHRRNGLIPARVVQEHKNRYVVTGERSTLDARVTGKMMHTADCRSDYPAVGDWVAVSARMSEGTATIVSILPRKSRFCRKVAWVRTEEQVVAANVDTVFLVSGLDHDFNLRRLERYLTLAWESGSRPVILLNKADLCPDAGAHSDQVETVAFGVPVHVISAVTDQGMDEVRALIELGKTAALLGSSGVGKSTIINRLVGREVLKVGEVRRSDSRGRHITSARQLVVLPGGGLVIDTPGMRELQLWADKQSLGASFDDIEDLAAACRFRDCTHQSEPGCAVKQAIEAGRLDAGRLKSYLKLQREVERLALRKDQRARLYEKSRWKKIAKASRQRRKHDPKGRRS
jgi:ribosome biogenesis GTPase